MSQPSGGADSAPSQRSSSSRSAQGLHAGAKAWSAQLLLLVLQAYVVMTDADMPEWIIRLIKGGDDLTATAGMSSTSWLHPRQCTHTQSELAQTYANNTYCVIKNVSADKSKVDCGASSRVDCMLCCHHRQCRACG